MADRFVNAFNGIQAYNKAIAAFVAGVVILFLQSFNFPVDDSVREAIEILALAAVVFWVPNKN